MTEKDLFNEKYDSEEFYYGLELSSEFMDFAERESLKPGTALDLGCGEGRYSIYLARNGWSVKAVDFSDKGIEKLRNYAEENDFDIEAEVADVRNYEIEEEKYDLIMAVTILDHINKENDTLIARRMKNALKPGGYLFAQAHTKQDPGYDPDSPEKSPTSAAIMHYFDSDELRRFFGDLDIIEYEIKKERDTSHGEPHDHVFAYMIARKRY